MVRIRSCATFPLRAGRIVPKSAGRPGVPYINNTAKKLLPVIAGALALVFAHAPLPAAGDAPGTAYDRIVEKKVIRIGVSRHYPPLNFHSGKKGVEIDMARELGRFLGVSVETVPLSLTEYVGAIESKKVDIVIAGLSRSLRRAKRIWFSEPYISITPGVLANTRAIPQTRFGDRFEQSPIRTIWDLKSISGFRFAVKEGSAYEELLENEFPDFPRTLVKTNAEGLKALKSGTVQGFVHDSLYLQQQYQMHPAYSGSYTLLQGGSRHEQLCAGLPFGDTILKNQVDIFIIEMKRLGRIGQLLEKYSVK